MKRTPEAGRVSLSARIGPSSQTQNVDEEEAPVPTISLASLALALLLSRAGGGALGDLDGIHAPS
jgi:hypothetical protein